MIITDTIYNTVKLYPRKVGVVCKGLRMTYEAFKERADRLSTGLSRLGLCKGDRAAILHYNCHVFMEVYYAAAQMGVILVPLNLRLSPRELAYMIDDSDSRLLFAHYDMEPQIMDLAKQTSALQQIVWTGKDSENPPPDATDGCRNLDYESFIEGTESGPYPEEDIHPDDPAHIFYTSGSTGKPKGAVITHKNMTYDALGTIAEYRLTDTDVYIHAAPMYHVADAPMTWAMTWCGGRHIYPGGRFEPGAVLKTFEQERVTVSKMVPTMWNMLVNHPDVGTFDCSTLRLVISGGAPIAPALVKQIMETFRCEYVQNYGMTETTQFLTISRLKENLRDLPPKERLQYQSAAGRPFLGVRLRVVDREGKDVVADGKQVGEVIVKGDTITPGYWNLPEENQKAFKEGWFYTGDLATMDAEGFIRIVDRRKDMIITGGENVYSMEVENVIQFHPAVLEAAVIGVPDPKWGEAVCAVCVLREGMIVEEAEIIQYCKTHLASYKAPKSVIFVKNLPKTGSGKIFKKALREQFG
ncbi:MAG: long-chain-fatty-acid--CoA ligase [Deltaproteobacteria bacterium]|nr:long-chain-fatty-acid--CoA ligase [Deltaproteobacteria bacterium]